MKSETKKRKHKKSPITKKLRGTVRQEAIPPYPQVPPAMISKKPGHDFYLYVNGTWLHTVKTPSYRSAYGVSEELEELIKENFLILLEKAMPYAKEEAQSRAIDEKAFKMMGQFGMSALRPKVQPKSISLLNKMINDINCLRNTAEITHTMALFATMRITGLLTFYTYFEPTKQILCKAALSPGQLGLPDISYYLREDSTKSSTLVLYGSMLDKLANLLHLNEQLSPVIHIETLFAKSLLKYQYQQEEFIEGRQLKTKFPHIDWDIFWKTLGYENWKKHTIKINPPGWIKTIDEMMKSLSLENWKVLFKTHLILHALPLLPPPFDDIHSEFYEKHLRGQSKKLPQKELTVRLLQEWMPSTMSRLYVKYFFDTTLKKETTTFVHLIQAAAIDRIQNTDWLTKKTRAKAIEKVKKMKIGVGFPNKMPPLEHVNLQTDNLFQNILLLGNDHTSDEIQKINKSIDIENQWEDAIYAVNAFYYSEVNHLILPAGSISWPFYHSKAPIGWNYGGLGAIIGHEMTHAFDSDGKDYNSIGQKEKWWTPQDNKEYSKRTKELIKLYNEARVLNHPVNGVLTLNENISDLGGLAIALDALHLRMKDLNMSLEKQKEAYRNFFTAYAVSWRIKEKPEKILQGLFMDRHAPAPLRVNLIVSQFDEWYEAFGIQVSDTLYIPPEERIRIF